MTAQQSGYRPAPSITLPDEYVGSYERQHAAPLRHQPHAVAIPGWELPDTGRPKRASAGSTEKLLKNHGRSGSRHNGEHKPLLTLILLMFIRYDSPCAVV